MSEVTEESVRAEVRAWLEANCPDSMRTPMPEDEVVWGGRRETYKNPESKLWLERMAERGWTCPTWPEAYGGGGLGPDENRILQEELRRIRARPPLQSFGIWMLGPALLHFGSHEQKLEYLPPIARGEVRWCQGYSEPGAGSDLANVQTRGEDRGDDDETGRRAQRRKAYASAIGGASDWRERLDEGAELSTRIRSVL